MKRNLLLKLFVISACSGVAALADPLAIDGTWNVNGQGEYQLMQASGEFFSTAYTASQDESVLITGYFENTDQYKVYVDGALVLTTPAIPGPAIDYGDTSGMYADPAAAYGSGLFSTGVFQVLNGDLITIQDIGPLFPNAAQAQNNGGTEFDAQVGLQAVPEPGTAGVLLLGAAALSFYLEKRRAKG